MKHPELDRELFASAESTKIAYRLQVYKIRKRPAGSAWPSSLGLMMLLLSLSSPAIRTDWHGGMARAGTS